MLSILPVTPTATNIISVCIVSEPTVSFISFFVLLTFLTILLVWILILRLEKIDSNSFEILFFRKKRKKTC